MICNSMEYKFLLWHPPIKLIKLYCLMKIDVPKYKYKITKSNDRFEISKKFYNLGYRRISSNNGWMSRPDKRIRSYTSPIWILYLF